MSKQHLDNDNFVSISWKLVFSAIFLVIVFISLSFLIIYKQQTQVLETETRKRAQVLLDNLASLAGSSIQGFNQYQLGTQVREFQTLEDIIHAAVVSPDGTIIAHSADNKRGLNWNDAYFPIRFTSPEATIYQEVTKDETTFLFLAKPIVQNDKILGYTLIEFNLSSTNKALVASRNQILGVSIILIGLAIFFVGLFARQLTSPILRLAHTALGISRGNLSLKATVDSNDEVGLLSRIINHMTKQLSDMVESEREARESLEQRVRKLLAFMDRVVEGDLNGKADPEAPDSLGRLIEAINEMVAHLKVKFEQEREFRRAIEKSRSQLQQANLKLREVDRMKSDFLNTVSHELRTPLTSIKAFAEILLDTDPSDQESYQEFLGIINKESDRLTRLINNLLDLSRIEAGKMNWFMEPISLSEVANDAFTTLLPSSNKKSVHMSKSIEEDLLGYGDKDKLTQVLTNLLGNALKFTKAGGNIHLSLRKLSEQQTAEFQIRDSGIGIDKKYHSSIFQKFSQVDSSETRQIKGSGLGLPIARNIIESHHGKIWVESQMGQGSTFFVTIPTNLKSKIEQLEQKKLDLVCITRDTKLIEHFQHVISLDPEASLSVIDNPQNITELSGSFYSHIIIDCNQPNWNPDTILEQLKTITDPEYSEYILLAPNTEAYPYLQLTHLELIPKPISPDRLFQTVQRLLQEVDELQLLEEHPIVIVDNDHSTLTFIETVIDPICEQCHFFLSGLEAMNFIEKQFPKLLILDIHLNDSSGYDVLHKLCLSHPNKQCPIILITGMESTPNLQATLRGSAAFFHQAMDTEQTLEWLKGTETRKEK